MNYVSIINIIFFALSILLSVYLLHFLFFAIVSIVHKRRFPETSEKCRFGVIISAKDEENVISRLINSIRSTDYPQDKLDIYVIAHNCSDKTGEVASSLGAKVITYNNPNEQTLGFAYHHAFQHIDVNEYDGFVFFNADNTLQKDYFHKMNDAFIYHEKNAVITSFRHGLNIKDGALPAIYSYYFAESCSLTYLGRESLNVSSRITGCGFLIPSRLLQNGWNYTSITEDIEFTADQICQGEIIHYQDDAIFFDEQPRRFKTMWFQRLRWAKGQNLTSRKYFPKLLSALFKKDTKNKASVYASLTFSSFIPLVFFFVFLAQIFFLLLSPLFGVSLQDAFLYWNSDRSWFENLFMSFNTGALYGVLKSLIWFFIASYLSLIGVIIASRGKYKGQPKMPLTLGFLLFPFFLLLQIPLDLTAMFVKNVKWKKIPHGEN